MFRPCALGVLLAFIASAAPPEGYYEPAQRKTGEELRQALHAIIRNHAMLPYSSSGADTSDALMVLDEDPANTHHVLLLYAQRSERKLNFGAANGWNREHLWPNSYGIDGRSPAYSDLHNLRAVDVDVNSDRANKFFDRSDTNSGSYRFPAHTEAQACSTDHDSWEPPDAVKGDIARAMFYMDVRYEGTSGEPDLVLTEGVQRITNATNFMGRLATLLLWHEIDPVDDRERQRNETIFLVYQNNRNPFVDHPEWVAEIFWPRLRVSMPFGPGGNVRVMWSPFTNAVLQVTSDLPPTWSYLIHQTANETNVWNGPARERQFFRLQLW